MLKSMVLPYCTMGDRGNAIVFGVTKGTNTMWSGVARCSSNASVYEVPKRREHKQEDCMEERSLGASDNSQGGIDVKIGNSRIPTLLGV